MSLQGAPQLRARMEAVAKTGPDISKRWQAETVRLAKLKVQRKTSNTSRSIQPRGTDEVVAASKVAVFLEYGTAPHVITPKAKLALRWAASSSDRRLTGSPRGRYDAAHKPISALAKSVGFIFAKIVHHPGTRPYPFLGPASVEALQKIALKGQVFIDRWNGAA